MRRILLVLALLVPFSTFAQSDPAEDARAAQVLLERAAERLASSGSARDRVRALTETVQAYEAGLSALRSGIRAADREQSDLAAALRGRDAEIAALLTALMRLGEEPSPVIFLHPAGAVGSARAAMLLSDVTPVLNGEAAQLRDDLMRIQTLQALQAEALSRLEAGLAEVQEARSALNQAIAERTDLPTRFTNDPVREAILVASSDTLAQFADGLDRVAVARKSATPARLAEEKGNLSYPVQGVVLRRSGEADAAGIARPGILMATRPKALVASPTSATIRYTGPLLNLGEVVILEPQARVLFILAGLDRVYGVAGEVIDAGSPLGLMGGEEPENPSALSTDGDDTGGDLTETLYIEVRQHNSPEDPSLWFGTDKDG